MWRKNGQKGPTCINYFSVIRQQLKNLFSVVFDCGSLLCSLEVWGDFYIYVWTLLIFKFGYFFENVTIFVIFGIKISATSKINDHHQAMNNSSLCDVCVFGAWEIFIVAGGGFINC